MKDHTDREAKAGQLKNKHMFYDSVSSSNESSGEESGEGGEADSGNIDIDNNVGEHSPSDE